MRNSVLSLIVMLCTSLYAVGVSYAAVGTLPPLPHQVTLIKGLQVIEQGQWSLGEDFISKASGGLSGQTFYWLKYSSDIQSKNVKWYRISRYVRAHKNWPGLRDMQKNAERAMPSDLSHKEVVKWFTAFSPVTPDGMMRYLDSLLALGQGDSFKSQLSKYWTQSLFGDAAQGKFLTKYGTYISRSTHSKRLTFLLGRSYYDTAFHLASHMGHGERSLVVATKALSKSKKNVSALIQNVPSSLKNHPALIYERMKWRRKKNMNAGAIELLNKAPAMTKELKAYDWWKERHIIVRRLMEEKRYSDAYRLASHHKQKDGLGISEAEFMSGWLALRFVNKPHQALQHFQTLYRNVKTPISKGRGAYWAGRASEAIGDSEKSMLWYKAAAYRETTYYGQRAEEALTKMSGGAAIVKSYPLISVSDEVWSKWVSDDRVTVMRLLYKAGLQDRALQFLSKMLNGEKNQAVDFMALAKISRLMGFHMGEVKVAKKAAYRAIILVDDRKEVYGYPLLKVSNTEPNIGLPEIHAIVRQESEFNPQAKSHAGARGYMQLMPATAKQVAKNLKVKHRTSWLTLRPEHNIRLGSSYLNSLMSQYKGNLALSAAAYNAGPHRVKQWMALSGDPRAANVDLIDWIELIPFSETRNYAQRVVEAAYIYRLRIAN